MESEEELKSLLTKVKEESETTGLKLSIQKAKIMISTPITSWHIEGGKVESVTDFNFLGSKITVDSDYSHEIKTLALWEEINDKSRECIKKQRHHLPIKVDTVKAIVFPVVMYGYELDYKESWALNSWCFWTVVLEKTFESPLDCNKIQPVHPKGNQS